MEKDLGVSLLLDFYGDLLTQKQRELTEMYYNDDMSLGEIAELVGITRQGVHDSVKRAEQIMNEAEAKVGFCAKYAQSQKGLNEIVRIAKAVSAQNKGYTFSKVTDEGTKEIIEIAGRLLG